MVSQQTSEPKLNWFKAFLQEGNHREPKGFIKKSIILIAVILTVFEVWLGAFGTMHPFQYAAIFYPLVLTVTFLVFSSTKRVQGNQPTWLDIIYSLTALGIEIFFLFHLEEYSQRIPMFNSLTPLEFVIGSALVFLTFEGTRRSLGSTLGWIVLIFMVYTFFGDMLSGAYSHRPITWNHFLDDMVFTINGIFGTPISVAATYVFMFVLFGAFFTQAGGGDFFFKFAAAISGRTAGGPAKVAVISSGLFGMISGSPTSDVLTTGSVNIPIMKRMGYSPIFAGGVEAAASTGGSILPPIMGTAAFLMAEYAGIPYSDIVIAALIPAVLYYLGIFLQVHFRAKKTNMPRMEVTENLLTVFKEGWINIVPLVFLVWGIMHGLTASYVTVITTALVIVTSWFKPDKRIGLRKFIEAIEETIVRMIPVTLACAAAGMLIDNIMLTGLAAKFGTLIFDFTYGNMFLTLLATALMCTIFGMGMPVSSAYILTAVMAAPILIKLGVPVLNSHLFIVYYSCLSAITPPVAVAAFAASSIARADPVKIGLNACKLAFIGFILPFMFVYQPGLLLEADIWTIILQVSTIIIGIIALAAAIEGWIIIHLQSWERLILLVAGICTIVPGTITDIIGIVLALAVILPKWMKRSTSPVSSEA